MTTALGSVSSTSTSAPASSATSATVRALRDSVAMRFDCDKVDANAQSAHFIYRNIARVLAARLGEYSVQLAALVEKTKSV